MNRSFNYTRLNTVFLNGIVMISRRGQGGGGGGDVPSGDIPEGYEDFFAFDGAFSAADGEFYVKQ